MTIAGLVGTVVIGAGQAGLALSARLQDAGHRHVVLERGRVAERWRSERWESLVLLTPDWLNRLPGERPPADPDGFSTGAALADRLDAHASALVVPVVESVTVLRIEPSGPLHRVVTDRGDWLAESVVDATGDCAIPVIPRVHGEPPVPTLHASAYRAPRSLPPGGVLVVGAGPTGQQLALELAADGRDVVLAVGRHARVPRRIGGRDIWSWLAALGDLDRTIDAAPDPAAARRSPSFPLSVRRRSTARPRGTAAGGRRLTGRLWGFAEDGRSSPPTSRERPGRRAAAATPARSHRGARARRRLLRRPPPIPLRRTPTALDLRAERIGSVLWATGFRRDVSHLPVAALGAGGEIVQRRGATSVPGLYVLGMRYQYRLASHLIGGVGADATHLADLIAGTRPARRPGGAGYRGRPRARRNRAAARL